MKDLFEKQKDYMIGYGSSSSNLNRVVANLCKDLEIPCEIFSHFSSFSFDKYIAVLHVEGVIEDSGETYNQNWILDTIHERIIPLQGYTPTSVQTTMDILRKNRQGV